jgi:hypothetical protein
MFAETAGILDHWTRAIVRYSEQHGIVNGVQTFVSAEYYTIARTNSMQVSTTGEATSCAATRYFPSILRNPEVHYRIHLTLSTPSPEPP